jgi:pterin-4a-carbinolamine dehydratase
MQNYHLPIKPRETQTPVIPTSRWRELAGVLCKTFIFKSLLERDQFVMEMLKYEQEKHHVALISILEDHVNIRVNTKNVDRPTNLDKEYAKFADMLYKDIAYYNLGM